MLGGEQAMFTDLQGLERLRGSARREDPGALREVAQQFESLFTHMMLQSMRSASFGDDLTGGKQMEFYRDMFDQQIAVDMSQGPGIGLADMIERELGGGPRNLPGSGGRDSLAALREQALPATPSSLPAPSGQAAAADFRPQRPEEFVDGLLPLARDAADRLGVAPRLVLAQAALETGWGQHMIRDTDGGNSFNLFGIKADNSWSGADVRVPTLEFEEGLPVRRSERFRAYDSLEEAMADYVDLIRESPRYREALDSGDDAAAFASALQAGGYATDPAYAEKIERVAGSDSLRGITAQGEAALKSSGERPFE